jgi:hypothetical protein
MSAIRKDVLASDSVNPDFKTITTYAVTLGISQLDQHVISSQIF